MNVVVLGAGALGTIVAAHLARDGHDVTVIARGDRARWIEEHGLKVRGLAEIDYRCRVVTDYDATDGAGLLVVTAKTYDNRNAITALPADGFDTVFSVANGVLKNDELADHFGAERVLGCMANTSGELTADGVVQFTRNVCLHLGELTGGTSARTDRVVEAFNQAGINTKVEDNIVQVEWSKFVGWAALLAVAVITRLPTGRFLSDPNCANIISRAIAEMADIAAAKDIGIVDLSPLPVASIAAARGGAGRDIVLDIGRDWLRNTPHHRLSALQDLERGKPLEVEETLGYAVSEARRLNLDTPTLATCYALASAINNAISPS